jgi:hypothetical protein
MSRAGTRLDSLARVPIFISGGFIMSNEFDGDWEEFMTVLRLICDDMDKEIRGE